MVSTTFSDSTMSDTDILWGEAEVLQQLFGQAVSAQETTGSQEIVLEIGPLVPISLIGDKVDDSVFDHLQIFF